jgi:putative FmdB family regulatory protein
MPIYEYRCERGHTFEVMQRMTDDPLTACSACEAPVQRVFHPVAVHFKGSGFYNTDYGKAKSKAGSSADASAAKPESKDGSKQDSSSSKSEAKGSSSKGD